MNGTTLIEGSDAISVSPNATVSITNNNFRFCKRAVVFGSTVPGTINVAPGGGIKGNTIIGSSTQAETGFVFNNVQNNLLLENNKFSDFDNGLSGQSIRAAVQVNKSNLTIVGGKFDAIMASASPMFAISITDESTVTITGNGTDPSTPSNAFILSCFNGIHVINSNLSISNALFNDISNGIVYDRPDTDISNKNLIVDNCRFENFSIRGIATNITIKKPLNLNNFTVKNSIFNSSSASIPNAAAIEVRARNISSVPILSIQNNIINRYGSNTFSGILLSQIHQSATSKSEIFYNTIKNASEGSNFKGLSLNSVVKIKIYGNAIGTLTTSSPVNSIGIEADASPGFRIQCNSLKGLSRGASFKNDCSSTNGLVFNEFRNCLNEGLFLDENEIATFPAIIGAQVKTENYWPGSVSAREALFEFAGYNPSSPNDVAMMQKSQFTVNTTEQSDSKWPSPRFVDVIDDAAILSIDNRWFKPSPYEPNNYNICSALGPNGTGTGLSVPEINIINGQMPTFRGYQATIDDAKYILFDRLSDYPDLRPSGSDAALSSPKSKKSIFINENILATRLLGNVSILIFRSRT
jgi:hypothetical protein